MIGIDVVDLTSFSVYEDARFFRVLQKTCTQIENQFILGSKFPQLEYWRLWTMKESTYKIISKSKQIDQFSPKKLETEVLNDSEGWVHSPWGSFYLISFKNSNYCLSISSSNKDCIFDFKIEICDQMSNPSLFTRNSLLTRVREKFSLEDDQISFEIRYQGSIPQLYQGIKREKADLSISHHGKYTAWALCYL
jgi:phosphopantetheinyl transferase (holo-ACP synthase)